MNRRCCGYWLSSQEDLIRYKSVLSRPVDVADIRAMREEQVTWRGAHL